MSAPTTTSPSRSGWTSSWLGSAPRCAAPPSSAAGLIVRTDDFTLDFGAKTARSAHRDVRLTPTEWRIVEVLVARAGQLVTNAQLLQSVWGPDRSDRDSTLRVHLGRIRHKLEPIPSRPQYFVTEVGLGYRFQSPEL